MYKFYKDNKFISFGFLISVIIIALYIKTKYDPELFEHAEDYFNLAFQLSVGFMASLIFFVMQVYLPRQKQIKLVNERILARIKKIVDQMREIIWEIGRVYNPKLKKDDLTEKDCLNILHKMNFDDKINLINPSKMLLYGTNNDSHYSVKEWLIVNVISIERSLDDLSKCFALYINPVFLELSDRICESLLHQCLVKTHLQNSIPISIANLKEDKYFTPYLSLMNELIAHEKYYS